MAKKKTQLNNFYALVWASIAGSLAFLISYFTLVFYLKSLVSLLFCSRFLIFLSFFLFCFKILIFLLSRFVPSLVLGSLVILLRLFLLGPASLHFAFLALKIFKQALLDKSFFYLISFLNFFNLFPVFGYFFNKIKNKRTFDIAFINFCLLVNNHA